MANIVFNAAKKIVCANPATDFYPVVTKQVTSAGGTPTNTTVGDVPITTLSSPVSSATSFSVALTGNAVNALLTPQLSTTTPSTCTVNAATGLVDSVANGTGEIIVSVVGKGSKSVKVSTSIATTATVTRNGAFPAGSLRKHMFDQVIAVTAGKVGEFALKPNTLVNWFNYPVTSLPAQAINQYLYTNTDKRTFWTRNNSHILSAVDLTGMSADRSYGPDGWTGGSRVTLLSPRHGLAANHWSLADGMTAYFVAADNTIVSAVIDGHYTIPGTDIRILHFSTDVPATIKPFKVLPVDFAKYLPIRPQLTGTDTFKSWKEYAVPAYLSFGGVINVGGFYWTEPLSYVSGSDENFTSYQYSTPLSTSQPTPSDCASLESFGNQVQAGSGSTVFTVINGEAVVLFALYLAGFAGRGPHREYAAINAAMTALHGSALYQLTPVSLAGFNATY